ncbi:MAG: hypothetical protein ACXVA9_13510 [Bdellovibrionales bacterium]
MNQAALIIVLSCLITVGAASSAEDRQTTFEESNCRLQSSLDANIKGWSFINKIGDRDAEGNERDVELQNCLTDQRTMAIEMSLIGTNTTQIADRGIVEFHPPGNKEDISRCSYYVQPGKVVSPDFLRYQKGQLTIESEGSIVNFMKTIDKIKKEAEEIAFIECEIS